MELAAGNATVGFVGRELPALRSIAEDFGARAFCYQADLCSDSDIKNLTKEIQKDVGHLDILVHNEYVADHQPYHPESLLQPVDVARVVTTVLALARTAEVTDINIRPLQKPLYRKD